MAGCGYLHTSLPPFRDQTSCIHRCHLHPQRQSRARPSTSSHNHEWAMHVSRVLRLGHARQL
eukprot:5584516-Pleurochrysis_carterae.AAC.1